MKVYVFCANAAGEPDVALFEVTASEADIEDGLHYGLARTMARDQNYQKPFFCADESEIGRLRERLESLVKNEAPATT